MNSFRMTHRHIYIHIIYIMKRKCEQERKNESTSPMCECAWSVFSTVCSSHSSIQKFKISLIRLWKQSSETEWNEFQKGKTRKERKQQ